MGRFLWFYLKMVLALGVFLMALAFAIRVGMLDKLSDAGGEMLLVGWFICMFLWAMYHYPGSPGRVKNNSDKPKDTP